MTRSEHLSWSKNRAMECARKGSTASALTSITSDLNKHPETANHPGIQLGMMLIMSGKLNGRTEIRKFIEGFN